MTAPQVLANRYQVLRTLGEGAMGLVLHVHDTSLDQEMALKVISGKVGANEKTILQFKQEFRLMTQLRHPNCCAVYDYGVLEDGDPYFTMEVVPGQGLDETGPLDEDAFRRVFAQLLLALGYIHNLGFVHRDIKSANVRLMPDGTVKLMDYGLMEYAGRSNAPISGTPAYIAPEIVKRGPIDQRTDLYSAGVLAYEMLTGKLPFGSGEGGGTAMARAGDTNAAPSTMAPEASPTQSGTGVGGPSRPSVASGAFLRPGDRVMAVLRAHVSERPVPPSAHRTGLDPVLERVVLRLMAKEPLERYRSAAEVLAALGIEASGTAGGNLLASPLVGRAPEMALLHERLGAIAQRGAGGVVALWGPTGVGKSRLVEEFRYAVQLENVPWAIGPCREQGGAPYAPFVAALKMLLPAFKRSARAELERLAPVLVKILPELDGTSGLPAFTALPDLDPPAKEKARLQIAVADALTALARVQPLTLVLEDWQWADPLSRELLTLLARTMGDAPIQIVLTVRPGEVDDGVPVTATRVPLANLDRTGVTRMVAAILGSDQVEEAFVRKVADLSDGSPFYVKELLDRLVQDGTLSHSQGRWNTHEELTPEKLPKNLKGLLMRKITYLSPNAQAIARVGAVAGAAFDLDLLAHVTGLADEELFAAMEILALTKVFEQAADGGYRFVQDQLRDTLYESIAAAERIRLHGAVADTLEARLGGRPLADAPLEVMTAIAGHYLAGDRPDKTVATALEAGRALLRLYALPDAKRFLEAGLALVRQAEEAGEDLRRTRFEYLRALGDVSRVVGEVERGAEVYAEALPLAEKLVSATEVAALITSLAKCHQMIGNLPEALAYCAKSLALAELAGDRAGAARSLLTSCRIHFYRGSRGEAAADTSRALAIARAIGDPFREAEAMAFLGYISIATGPETIAAGIDYLDRAIAILTAQNDKIGLQNALNLLGNAQNMLGDPLAARATFERNLQICMELGLRADELVSYLNLAICASELGDFEQSVAFAVDAKERAELNHDTFHTGLSLILEALPKCYLGQFTGSLDLADRALTMAIEAKNKYVEAIAMQYKVEMCLVIGHLGMAKTSAKELIALIKETGNTEPEIRMNVCLGEIVARQGDLGGGGEYVKLALEEARAAGAKSMEARALKVRAWIAVQTGEWAEAKSDAEVALALARKLGMKYLIAELEGVLGEIALATRQGDAMYHFENMEDLATITKSDLLLAMAQFGQAAAIGSPMQAVPLVQKAQALLQALLAPLDEDTRLCFGNLRERSRILEGDFVGGFRPRSATIDMKVSLPGIKLGGGGLFGGLS